MDTATSLALVGLVVAVLFGVAGLLFGLDQRRTANEIKRQLSGVLDLLRERDTATQPATTERLAEDTATLGQRFTDAQKKTLADAIVHLPEREQLVVTLYYYEALTMKEIADVLGVSQSRVSQLHTKAILRLKNEVEGMS